MSGEKCRAPSARPTSDVYRSGNGWKAAAIKLLFALVGLVSFVALTFAGVTWSRAEEHEDRIVEVEKKQAVLEWQVGYIADGVKRLEDKAGTYVPPKPKD